MKDITIVTFLLIILCTRIKTACNQNCVLCQSSTCFVCKPGYSGSSCVKIACLIPNCAQCVVTYSCTTCVVGYSGIYCTIPSISCNIPNCNICASTTTCATCAPGYNGTLCTPINPINPIVCIKNCLLCSNSISCNKCATGYNGNTCLAIVCGIANCSLC